MIIHKRRKLEQDIVIEEEDIGEYDEKKSKEEIQRAIDLAVGFGGWVGIDARTDEENIPLDIQCRDRESQSGEVISNLFSGPHNELRPLKLFAIIYKVKKGRKPTDY